jgi:hypothetical protein
LFLGSAAIAIVAAITALFGITPPSISEYTAE